MENKNGGKIAFFIFIILLFIIGGYFLMINRDKFLKNNKIIEENIIKNEEKDIRIDNTKDYIYFSNVEHVVEELDIDYYEIHFNFSGNDNLEKKINEETKKLKEENKFDEKDPLAVYNHLTFAKYNQFDIISYSNYLSLVEKIYTYDNTNLVSFIDSKTYVFDKKTGKLLSNEELLRLFNTNVEQVRGKVKTFIEDANLINEGEELDAVATVNNLKNNLALYVDKLGRLTISILVKSNQKDYNESVVLS